MERNLHLFFYLNGYTYIRGDYMLKRFFDLSGDEIINLNKDELKQAIKSCEARIVLSENVVVQEPATYGVTSSELAKAFGADLILLNFFDVNEKKIKGLDYSEGDIIKKLKNLVKRPIGLNLEPVQDKNMFSEKKVISEGRKASEENIKKLDEMGFDFVMFTGNPGTGVDNEGINEAIKFAKKYFHGLIFAGKMHSSGVDEKIADLDVYKGFLDAGADVLSVPAVGTCPGVFDEDVRAIVELAHKNGALAMTTIGTSQESSPKEVIRDIALRNKILGADIQHIGDSGYGGLAICENIFELSRTLRGDRHTFKLMAASINR